MPVPKNRNDEPYFAFLRAVEDLFRETDFHLGLVHANDEEGTRHRIRAALNVADKVGLATECGMGRSPAQELPSILNISAEVSNPWI